MDKELKLSSLQYQQGLAAFYPLYIAAEIPSNLVLKRITPRIWISLMAFLWGVICMCLGFVHDFEQFITLRALLGLAEGGLFPGMVLYLSTIYTRSELALRIGVLYMSTSLSSGFGGLLARAMGAIGDRGGLTAWRWIFVIEGLFVSSWPLDWDIDFSRWQTEPLTDIRLFSALFSRTSCCRIAWERPGS